MAAVVQGVHEVRRLLNQPPVVIGGLAVLARLSKSYRATVDLDLVDRLVGVPQLQVLRAATGAVAVEPAAVMLPTTFGPVTVDVLEVRQVELDQPSDDPGDRLHATAHAWASDTAGEMTIEVERTSGQRIEVVTPVAEPGPLVAMKLQSVMNREALKQGTDLLDIVRLTLDPVAGRIALSQIRAVADHVAYDVAAHVDLWFISAQERSLRWIRNTGNVDVTVDDLELVAELLLSAAARPAAGSGAT